MTPEAVASEIPWRTMAALFVSAEGTLSAIAFVETHPELDFRRWFAEESELIHSGGRTYALTKMWGAQTEEAVNAILAILTNRDGIHYTVAA